MSGNLAYARPLQSPQRVERPRHIEIVATREQRRARPRLAYAVVTVASLFAIFAAQLLLSILVSQGAYEIASLKTDQKELLRTEQDLRETLDRLDSTQNLAAQAAHLGMVPNASPLALNLATGGVYGMPGSADPTGCGGACNLVPNALTTQIPLVDPASGAAASSPAGPRSAGTAASSKPGAPPVVDALPAPVTH
jgi:hypothetical protein